MTTNVSSREKIDVKLLQGKLKTKFATHSTDKMNISWRQRNNSTMLLFCIVFVISFGLSISSETVNFLLLPGLPETTYSQLGDINVGAMADIMVGSSLEPSGACSDKVKLSSYTVESTEAVAFAVDYVNRSPHILPNVSLGFVVRSTCYSAGITIGTSLSFLPRAQRHNMCNSSTCFNITAELDSAWTSHDVIGVMGPGWSSLAVPVSSLYAVGHLPLMGSIETSDELSNKRIHPYFFRIVPPDMYQVEAMLRFISSKGWSYISVIYEDGSYGQKAFDRIQKNADQYGICVATSHRLIQPPKYDHIVSDLLMNYRARVVVLFIERGSFQQILQSLIHKNVTHHFIWVASESLASYRGYEYKGVNYDPAIGTFIFNIHTSHVPNFFEHLQQQNISSTKNPWLKSMWEYFFDCSYNEGTCDSSLDMTKSSKFYAHTETTLRIDAVLTLAWAAHNLLSIRCPDARGPGARACITGELLREFLKNTSFEGFNGRVKFDQNQDVKGEYVISQLVYDYVDNPFGADIIVKKGLSKKTIGFYDVSTDTFTYYKKSVSWAHLNSPYYDINMTDNSVLNEAPQSTCSSPCRVGEYKIEKELPCCWDCRMCRENEHLVDGNTTCEPCPQFTWPDSASGFTTCIDSPLTYPMFNDPIPIAFTSLAIVALVITMVIIVSYAIYRNERVIKASSRELSVIQLFAIFTGYATVILFQIKPSDTLCSSIFFMFCMSFVLLYSPLLVKTVRICRIFKSGNKNEKPRFISPNSQLVFANSLNIVQVALCIAVYILYWPKARRTQPIWSEKLVELSCDLTFPGVASFLGYNIVLVSLCSVFAFMVRKLPDNFNESKFISMCVTTTLLIWLAFIPAYFTAHREFVRVFLLSVALFLNHSVALMFLFLPKIYAAKFIPAESGEFSKNRS